MPKGKQTFRRFDFEWRHRKKHRSNLTPIYHTFTIPSSVAWLAVVAVGANLINTGCTILAGL